MHQNELSILMFSYLLMKLPETFVNNLSIFYESKLAFY